MGLSERIIIFFLCSGPHRPMDALPIWVANRRMSFATGNIARLKRRYQCLAITVNLLTMPRAEHRDSGMSSSCVAHGTYRRKLRASSRRCWMTRDLLSRVIDVFLAKPRRLVQTRWPFRTCRVTPQLVIHRLLCEWHNGPSEQNVMAHCQFGVVIVILATSALLNN